MSATSTRKRVYKPVPYKPWRPTSPQPSQRELQVLGLMSEGTGYTRTAEVLKISLNTVRTHSKRLFLRIGARDRGHAVRLGFERGWLVTDQINPDPIELLAHELQLLDLLSRGLTYVGIGRRLGLSEAGTRDRVVALYRRLGVHDRAHAVRLGFEHGLLTPGGGDRG